MRGTIDSCMAKKLPPIAARNFAAVRPGHMCHMSHAFASKLAFRYRLHPSLKSQSVSFFSHFLNCIMLYYDAFFTRGVVRSQATHTFFVTSHTTVVPHVMIWHVATVPLCSIENPPKSKKLNRKEDLNFFLFSEY